MLPNGARVLKVVMTDGTERRPGARGVMTDGTTGCLATPPPLPPESEVSEGETEGGGGGCSTEPPPCFCSTLEAQPEAGAGETEGFFR